MRLGRFRHAGIYQSERNHDTNPHDSPQESVLHHQIEEEETDTWPSPVDSCISLFGIINVSGRVKL